MAKECQQTLRVYYAVLQPRTSPTAQLNQPALVWFEGQQEHDTHVQRPRTCTRQSAPRTQASPKSLHAKDQQVEHQVGVHIAGCGARVQCLRRCCVAGRSHQLGLGLGLGERCGRRTGARSLEAVREAPGPLRSAVQ